MKTRFSSLVKIKKNAMQRCELEFQRASANVHNAKSALQEAYKTLESIEMPENGSMKLMLANRATFAYQREVIKERQRWVAYADQELSQAKAKLKELSLEYEKFNYLEIEEIKKILLEQKKAEAKAMDEVAILSYDTRISR